jgi:hypothetical protein
MNAGEEKPGNKTVTGFLTYAVMREMNPSLPDEASEEFIQFASLELAQEWIAPNRGEGLMQSNPNSKSRTLLVRQ